MIISDMKQQANEVKKIAEERIAKYEEERKEKEVRSVFDWIIKLFEKKIKNTIEYDSNRKAYVFKLSFFIQENQTIVIKNSGIRYLTEELGIYKAQYVNDAIFKDVVRKVLVIFESIEGYNIWSDLTENSFSISLIINKGE